MKRPTDESELMPKPWWVGSKPISETVRKNWWWATREVRPRGEREWGAQVGTMFNHLVWLPDRMVLDELVFRLEHTRSDEWDGGEHFRFYKTKELVDQYEAFFSRRPVVGPRLLELGIFDGGSTVF